MRQKIMGSLSVVATLLGVLLWTAAGVGADEAAAPVSAPEPAYCNSRLDEAYIQLGKKLERQSEAVRRHELEAGARAVAAWRQEEEALRHYQSEQRQESVRKQRVVEQIADLVPEQYQMTVVDVAERFDVEPRLVAAIGLVESKWYARAVGTHGDSGLMQILPSTAEWIAEHMGLESYDIFDPVTNLNMGTWYLRTLYDQYGSWDEALAAYNGGPAGATLGAAHPYARRVLSVYRQQGT